MRGGRRGQGRDRGGGPAARCGPDGRQTVKRKFKTFYGVLAEAARWLVSLGVTHVAMEATGIYSMPVYHALAEYGDFAQVLVCNCLLYTSPSPRDA